MTGAGSSGLRGRRAKRIEPHRGKCIEPEPEPEHFERAGILGGAGILGPFEHRGKCAEPEHFERSAGASSPGASSRCTSNVEPAERAGILGARAKRAAPPSEAHRARQYLGGIEPYRVEHRARRDPRGPGALRARALPTHRAASREVRRVEHRARDYVPTAAASSPAATRLGGD